MSLKTSPRIEAQIKTLKDITSKWETVNVTSPAYVALENYMSNMPREVLALVATRDIKFISNMARNRLGS